MVSTQQRTLRRGSRLCSTSLPRRSPTQPSKPRLTGCASEQGANNGHRKERRLTMASKPPKPLRQEKDNQTVRAGKPLPIHAEARYRVHPCNRILERSRVMLSHRVLVASCLVVAALTANSVWA